MTYEQALEIKQNLTAEQARNDLERYLLRNEPPIYKGVALAMQALEKQIPKKLIINEKDGMRHCPNCDTFFLSGGKRHCEKCGQALDWSEEE